MCALVVYRPIVLVLQCACRHPRAPREALTGPGGRAAPPPSMRPPNRARAPWPSPRTQDSLLGTGEQSTKSASENLRMYLDHCKVFIHSLSDLVLTSWERLTTLFPSRLPNCSVEVRGGGAGVVPPRASAARPRQGRAPRRTPPRGCTGTPPAPFDTTYTECIQERLTLYVYSQNLLQTLS